MILTQTLQLLADPGAALANLEASLVPGGVLLVTVPSLSRLDLADRDYWRWTPAGLEALCRRALPGCDVAVSRAETPVRAAFFVGLSAENVGQRVLGRDDPNFPVVACARRQALGRQCSGGLSAACSRTTAGASSPPAPGNRATCTR